ncbi:MAG: DUF1326 domain-containing protein [Pirellulaceae bacterium]|nr:DUF1326 domain-containing protein [Planctomycetales bacterium]
MWRLQPWQQVGMCALASCLVTSFLVGNASADDLLVGTYLEARTCQVYTGPCFAAGEVGSTGKDAVLAWRVTNGKIADADLAGLCVAMVVKSSHTLGFEGFGNAESLRAVLFVDEQADASQQSALTQFAMTQTGLGPQEIAEVRTAPMTMQFDSVEITASLDVRDAVKLSARKARKGDCICSNESAYYPPLVRLAGSAPGVTLEGDVTARKLGRRWSIPDSRTAFLGRFEVNASAQEVRQARTDRAAGRDLY